MEKIILNTNVISVKLLTPFQKELYSRIPKRCFTIYISGKMNLQQKDQKSVSGKTELFGEKGSVS